jgi:hypothetical protein
MRPCMAGNCIGELDGELPARSSSYSTWAKGHSFINYCHRLLLIFGAICALLSCNGMTAPGTWMLRTDSEAPHKSETQHCSMLGSMHSMTGYTCLPGIVNRLRALYLVVEYSTHAVQMVTWCVFGFVLSLIDHRPSNDLALGPLLAMLYYCTS